MNYHKSIAGKRFSRLVTIKRVSNSSYGAIRYLCKCDCGKRKIIVIRELRVNKIKSCGCLKREATLRTHTTHNMSKTPIYKLWAAMIARCTNKLHNSYKNYGGRGIKVSKTWIKFENFYKDMGNRPEKLTLERINNNKGYSKINCRWATRSEQAYNRRKFINKE